MILLPSLREFDIIESEPAIKRRDFFTSALYTPFSLFGLPRYIDIRSHTAGLSRMISRIFELPRASAKSYVGANQFALGHAVFGSYHAEPISGWLAYRLY